MSCTCTGTGTGSGSGMNNPTYDEHQGTPTLNNMTIIHEPPLEKEFDNPIYSDETIDIDSDGKINSQQQNSLIPHYEGVCFESTAATVNEALYESADLGSDVIQGAAITATNTTNGIEANDGEIMKGATSREGVYELPPNLDDADDHDENCYSTLNPTYSQLPAHTGVPKPVAEVQIPQNDDDYSRLQYKY
jgi:hypothetical protein